MITVAIVVCDRDARLLPRFLDNVEVCVHIPHEVIIFDNTEISECGRLDTILSKGAQQVAAKSLGDRIKVLRPTFGGKEYKVNVRQLEARRQLILAMTGDWIWFVDPDDEVLPIDTEYNDDCGLLNFDCYVNEVLVRAVSGKAMETTGVWCNGNWCKWYSKEVAQKVAQMIPSNTRISAHEDDFISAAAFKIAGKTEGIHTPIYCFNGGLSDGRLLSSAAELHTYMDGWRECADLFDKTFTEDELKAIYPYSGGKAAQYFLDIIASKCAQSAADDPSLFEPLFGALEETADRVLIREALLRKAKYDDEDALTAAMRLGAEKKTRQPVSIMLDRRCNLQCPYCCQGDDREVKPRYSDDEVYKRFDAAMTKLETLAGDALYPQVLGGEPTLWSDYLIGKIAKRLERYPQFLVFTNGTNRQSAWYKVHNAKFLTHVTDWAETMKSYEYENDRDVPTIVVTHKDMNKIGEYLDINKCRSLLVSPATDSKEPSLNCTTEDILRLRDLKKAHGLDGVWRASIFADTRGKMRICNGIGTTWQVDCMAEPMIAAACCKSGAKGYVPLGDFTGTERSECTRCMIEVA